MPLAINYSMSDIEKGLHCLPSTPTVLIQIQNYDCKQFIEPKYKSYFTNIFRFNFDDEEDVTQKGVITEAQSARLAKIITQAYQSSQNIFVHCHAGICRSGAIVEVCKLIGFETDDLGEKYGLIVNRRIPNVLVFNKLRKQLGFLNSWE